MLTFIGLGLCDEYDVSVRGLEAIRAAERGIQTRIIHGASITTAVCGLCGLQNYRFGKSVSVPFPYGKWFPMTPIEVISANLAQNLHTLVFLDIQKDKERYMHVSEAVDLLEEQAARAGVRIPLYVGIARAGSATPVVHAGDAEEMRRFAFGDPLHIMVVPGELHDIEREYLVRFAGLC